MGIFSAGDKHGIRLQRHPCGNHQVREVLNGIKNIIAHLGGQVFPRIKVGVGEKPPKYDLADYVLGHFSKAEQELMSEGYDNAVKAVELIVSDQISEAMNEYNRKKKDE